MPSSIYSRSLLKIGVIAYLIIWLYFIINLQYLVSTYDRKYSKNNHPWNLNSTLAFSHFRTNNIKKNAKEAQIIKAIKVQQYHHAFSSPKKIISAAVDSNKPSILKKEKITKEVQLYDKKNYKIDQKSDDNNEKDLTTDSTSIKHKNEQYDNNEIYNKMDQKDNDKKNHKMKSSTDSTSTKHNTATHALGGSFKNPQILAKGCAVTVLFVDPRISNMQKHSDAWYSLESMAVNSKLSIFYYKLFIV